MILQNCRMNSFTKDELEKALNALSSLISKCEKVQVKSTLGAAQRTLLENRIKAFQIASSLIKREMEG